MRYVRTNKTEGVDEICQDKHDRGSLCVCIYVYVCVCMYVCVYAGVYVCVYVLCMYYVCICLHVCVCKACLLSQLHHPNIVSYKESFQDSHGVLHIVMGYCERGDLSSRLKAYGQQLLPESQVVEWFVQIALALQYLHERNILHRDLKVRVMVTAC